MDNTTQSWISFQVGTVNADSGNLTNDDYGMPFRRNGGTECFGNTVNLGAGGAFTATPGGVSRRVEINHFFRSFADGMSRDRLRMRIPSHAAACRAIISGVTERWDFDLENGGGTRLDERRDFGGRR